MTRSSDHQPCPAIDFNTPTGWADEILDRIGILALSYPRLKVQGHSLRYKPAQAAWSRVTVTLAGRITGTPTRGKAEAFCSCSLTAKRFVDSRAQAWQWWATHLDEQGLSEAARRARGEATMAGLAGDPEPQPDLFGGAVNCRCPVYPYSHTHP